MASQVKTKKKPATEAGKSDNHQSGGQLSDPKGSVAAEEFGDHLGDEPMQPCGLEHKPTFQNELDAERHNVDSNQDGCQSSEHSQLDSDDGQANEHIPQDSNAMRGTECLNDTPEQRADDYVKKFIEECERGSHCV